MFEDGIKSIIVPQVYLPIIYIIVAVLIYGIIRGIISKAITIKQNQLAKTSYAYKKTETFKVLFQNIAKYVIVIFVILAILNVFGVNVSSILAGIGLIGLVLGLAFQDIAKDFIAGFTIILENQYAIGDTISIGGFKGEVVFLGLKSTRIRNYEGDIKILANRNITEVINHSMANSLAVVDISISHEENLEKVEAILEDEVKQLTKKLTKLKGVVELLGIQSLEDSAIIYRITVETAAMEHFRIQREIRKAIKTRLNQEKISMPYPQVEVHNGK